MFLGLAVMACSGSKGPAPAVVSVAPAAAQSTPEPLPRGAWFQPNGSIVAVDSSGQRSPELSAPIAPCVVAQNKNGFYPPARQEQEQMGDEASLTFSYFLEACTERYSLVRAAADRTLTPQQARDNYEKVARCTFETHYGKPYWVPQLVDDVDLCGRALGRDWQLPTSEALTRFNAEHRELLFEALEDVPFGGGYNSILMYARGEDQKLTLIDLAPPGTRRNVEPISLPTERKTSFQAPAISLRCVRDARTLPATDVPAVRAEARGCAAELSATMSAEGAKTTAAAPAEPGPAAPVDPAILRLSRHTEALAENPASFNPRASLREVQRAAAVAKKTYASARDSQAQSTAKMEALGRRYEELRLKLQSPKTADSERPRLQAELRNLHLTIAAEFRQGFAPILTPDQELVQDALRTMSSLTHTRFRHAASEFKHWVVAGKPKRGKVRSLAAIEQEVHALRRLEQELDAIRGTNLADSLQLPPRSDYQKFRRRHLPHR